MRVQWNKTPDSGILKFEFRKFKKIFLIKKIERTIFDHFGSPDVFGLNINNIVRKL